jgi:hypothetical protein
MAISGIVMAVIYSTLYSQQNPCHPGTDRGYAAEFTGCLETMFLYEVSILFFLVSTPVTGFAKSPPKGLIRSGLVKTDGKANTALIVKERHFSVTESTTILDNKGKKIQLDNLPIPCKAKTRYRLRMDQDPEALKVVVKKPSAAQLQLGPLENISDRAGAPNPPGPPWKAARV